ncbi:MAG: histidine kinase [Nitrospinae bacterium CG11_big_fil_rev_8_21_14_0_20_56_8]|nr:MAG: histidine kinase [Nitrospinae bacterium CG11_big_fil_rev_8_21_14_0_20_56_8]
MPDACILMVDDEPNVLQGYKRRLHGEFAIDTAVGPEIGLKAIGERSYAVVVSDLRMPQMDGIEFLARVRETAPDTIRVMLTGFAEVDKAIDAVNRGNIFRFLTKPCEDHTLISALKAALEQYRLVMAERELLEKTLKGSIDILTEILSLVHPDIFGQTMQMRELIRTLAGFLNIKSYWEIEVAAMLSAIGYVGIPPEILYKLQAGGEMKPDEKEMLSLVPEIGAHLLVNIPRLTPVSKIIYYQDKLYEGSGFPRDSVKGEKIPLGARIVKPLADLLKLERDGVSRKRAMEIMQGRPGWYDPKVMEKIVYCFSREIEETGSETDAVFVTIKELVPGQFLLSDVVTSEGRLLLSSGQRLTGLHIQRISNYSRLEGVREPIRVK